MCINSHLCTEIKPPDIVANPALWPSFTLLLHPWIVFFFLFFLFVKIGPNRSFILIKWTKHTFKLFYKLLPPPGSLLKCLSKAPWHLVTLKNKHWISSGKWCDWSPDLFLSEEECRTSCFFGEVTPDQQQQAPAQSRTTPAPTQRPGKVTKNDVILLNFYNWPLKLKFYKFFP